VASTHTQPRANARAAARSAGGGWLTYSGILVLIGGVLNVIWGIAAIDSANFFVANAAFVISDLNLWGWISLGIGALMVAAGIGIFSGVRWAIWMGIACASVNAVVQLLSIPAYPFWALAVFALDLLVVYGLVAYGDDA
jgi:hypothetical protein